MEMWAWGGLWREDALGIKAYEGVRELNWAEGEVELGPRCCRGVSRPHGSFEARRVSYTPRAQSLNEGYS